MNRYSIAILLAISVLAPAAAFAEQVGCVTTEWKLIGANHKVCVESFNDPKVPGVTCHVSQARTGGVSGSLGLAQDPSQFSLACRQTGPITLPAILSLSWMSFPAINIVIMPCRSPKVVLTAL